jgi:undecaprenyl-diphosphatase
MIEDILAYDLVFFRMVNEGCKSPFLDKAVPLITQLAYPLIFVLALLLLLFRSRTGRMTGILLMAGATFCHYAVQPLKAAVQRPRPYLVIDGVNSLLPASGYSMPSGHTAISFMAAFILTRSFGRWYIFYPLAALIGFTRIYLGVHYPSDVLAGAAVGMFIGGILTGIAEDIRKRP